MSKLFFVLGAPDHEMTAIEDLLKDCEVGYKYAVDFDGNRVHPGNAYKTGATIAIPVDADVVVLVECNNVALCNVRPACDPEPLPPHVKIVNIDHHNPGDSGYAVPPERFLEGSSIGQVLLLLVPEYQCHQNVVEFVPSKKGWAVVFNGEWTGIVSEDVIYTAAADHCLAAAYAGKCHGVKSDKMLKFRIKQKAEFAKCDEHTVAAKIDAARLEIQFALNETHMFPIDLRDQTIEELPEAACIAGVAYVSTVTEPSGRVKDVLGGCTTPELVKQWMFWMKAEGREVYGNPTRGFAGAYRVESGVKS